MGFNPSKCQVLHISKSRHPVSTQYSLHNQALESVDGAKYLGVHLIKDISWTTHVNNITSSACKTLGFVKRNVNTTNQLSESWLTRHVSAHNWNMLPVCGVRLLK